MYNRNYIRIFLLTLWVISLMYVPGYARATMIEELEVSSELAAKYYLSLDQSDAQIKVIVDQLFELPPETYEKEERTEFQLEEIDDSIGIALADDAVSIALRETFLHWIVLEYRFGSLEGIRQLQGYVHSQWPDRLRVQNTFVQAKKIFEDHQDQYTQSTSHLHASVQDFNELVDVTNEICKSQNFTYRLLAELKRTKNYTTSDAQALLFPQGKDPRVILEGGYDDLVRKRLRGLYAQSYFQLYPYWTMLFHSDLGYVQQKKLSLTSDQTQHHIQSCVQKGVMFEKIPENVDTYQQKIKTWSRASWIDYKDAISDIQDDIDDIVDDTDDLLESMMQTSPRALRLAILKDHPFERTNYMLTVIDAYRSSQNLKSQLLPWVIDILSIIPFIGEFGLFVQVPVLAGWVGYAGSNLINASLTIDEVQRSLASGLIQPTYGQEIIFQMKSQLMGSTVSLGLAGIMGARALSHIKFFTRPKPGGAGTGKSPLDHFAKPNQPRVRIDGRTPYIKVPKGTTIKKPVQSASKIHTKTTVPAGVQEKVQATSTVVLPKVKPFQSKGKLHDAPEGAALMERVSTMHKLQPVRTQNVQTPVALKNVLSPSSWPILAHIPGSMEVFDVGDPISEKDKKSLETYIEKNRQYFDQLSPIEIAKLIVLGQVPYDPRYENEINMLAKGGHGKFWENVAKAYLDRVNRLAYYQGYNLSSVSDQVTSSMQTYFDDMLAAAAFLSDPDPKNFSKEVARGLTLLSGINGYVGTKARRFIAVESLRGNFHEYQRRTQNIEPYLDDNVLQIEQELRLILNQRSNVVHESIIAQIARQLSPDFSVRTYSENSEGENPFSFDVLILTPHSYLSSKSIGVWIYVLWDQHDKPYFFITSKKYTYKSKIYPIDQLGQIKAIVDYEGYTRSFADILDQEYFVYSDANPPKQRSLQEVEEVRLEMIREVLIRESRKIQPFQVESVENFFVEEGGKNAPSNFYLQETEIENLFTAFDESLSFHHPLDDDRRAMIALLYYVGYLKTIRDMRFSPKDLHDVLILHMSLRYGYEHSPHVRRAVDEVLESSMSGPYNQQEMFVDPVQFSPNLSSAQKAYRQSAMIAVKQDKDPAQITSPVLTQLYAYYIESRREHHQQDAGAGQWLLRHGFPIPSSATDEFYAYYDQAILFSSLEIEQKMRDVPEFKETLHAILIDRLSQPTNPMYIYLKNQVNHAIENPEHLTAHEYTSMYWAVRYLQDTQAMKFIERYEDTQKETKHMVMDILTKNQSGRFTLNGREILIELKLGSFMLTEKDPETGLNFDFIVKYTMGLNNTIDIRTLSATLLRMTGTNAYHSHLLTGKNVYDLMFYYFTDVLQKRVASAEVIWKAENHPMRARNYTTYRYYRSMGYAPTTAIATTWAGRQWMQRGYNIDEVSIERQGDLVYVKFAKNRSYRDPTR